MKVQQRLLAFQETVKVDDVTKKTGLVFSGDVGFFVGFGFFLHYYQIREYKRDY